MLSDIKVSHIKARIAEGMKQPEIARRYKVSRFPSCRISPPAGSTLTFPGLEWRTPGPESCGRPAEEG